MEIKPWNVKLDTENIKTIETLIGSTLPQEYIKFISEYNGGTVDDNIIFLVNSEIESISISEFLGFGYESNFDVNETYFVLKGALPEQCVPIANAEGGNVVFINLNVDNYGSVYLWDHETEDTYYIAKDFSIFIQMIRDYHPEDEDLNGYEILDVWIDPDFLNELERSDD